MIENSHSVIGGVDTHAATHHAAVLDAATGSCLADAEFAATTAGYRQLGEFLASHGQVLRVGVEGTIGTKRFTCSEDRRWVLRAAVDRVERVGLAAATFGAVGADHFDDLDAVAT